MKKLTRSAVTLLLLVGMVTVIGAAPAGATGHTDVGVVAAATARCDGSLGLPPPSASVTCNVTGGVQVWAFGNSVTADVNVNGACGLSSGGGTVYDSAGSHNFTYQSAGTLLVLKGPRAFGVVNAVAVPGLDGSNSCRTGTANTFTVSGVLLLTHDPLP